MTQPIPNPNEKIWVEISYHGKSPVTRLISRKMIARMRDLAMRRNYDVIITGD